MTARVVQRRGNDRDPLRLDRVPRHRSAQRPENHLAGGDVRSGQHHHLRVQDVEQEGDATPEVLARLGQQAAAQADPRRTPRA